MLLEGTGNQRLQTPHMELFIAATPEPSRLGDVLMAFLSIVFEGAPYILVGTVLSGWVFQRWGLAACLAISAALIAVAAAVSVALPRSTTHVRG